MERIGTIQYNLLKSMPVKALSPEETEKITQYETETEPTEEQIKFRQEYGKRLWSETEYVKPKFDAAELLESLIGGGKDDEGNLITGRSIFFQVRGYEFKPSADSLQALKTLIYYFIEDQRFFKSPNLTRLSAPSFHKGALIVGGYGNGKSSMFEILRMFFCNYRDYSFKSYNANAIIEMYETSSGYHEKQEFWNNVLRGRCHFDDVKTERAASNYGKTNLFKDILEKRYDSRIKTYITCNYHEQHPGDIQKAINEFGEKYGGRVHDRVFEMFNILEFNGKSYRE